MALNVRRHGGALAGVLPAHLPDAAKPALAGGGGHLLATGSAGVHRNRHGARRSSGGPSDQHPAAPEV